MFSLLIATSSELSYTKVKIITLQYEVFHWLYLSKFTWLCAISWTWRQHDFRKSNASEISGYFVIFWRLLANSTKRETAVNKTAVCVILIYCAVILPVWLQQSRLVRKKACHSDLK